jgi:uncharacterized protein YkwD
MGSESKEEQMSKDQQLFDLINSYRETEGVAPLDWVAEVAMAAQHHSEDMAEFDFFDHKTVQSSFYPVGSHGEDRMAQEGYEIGTWAENIACGQGTAEETLEAWQQSQGHNEILLYEGYRVIGIGMAEGSTECSPYWTADFAAAQYTKSLVAGAHIARREQLTTSSMRRVSLLQA